VRLFAWSLGGLWRCPSENFSRLNWRFGGGNSRRYIRMNSIALLPQQPFLLPVPTRVSRSRAVRGTYRKCRNTKWSCLTISGCCKSSADWSAGEAVRAVIDDVLAASPLIETDLLEKSEHQRRRLSESTRSTWLSRRGDGEIPNLNQTDWPLDHCSCCSNDSEGKASCQRVAEKVWRRERIPRMAGVSRPDGIGWLWLRLANRTKNISEHGLEARRGSTCHLASFVDSLLTRPEPKYYRPR
jgi:hypothetical protein